MSDQTHAKPAAVRATDERFLKTVMGEDRRYPDGSEFVASSTPGLAEIVNRNLRDHRPTVIVHDDGSDIVIEPRDMRLGALAAVFLLGVLVRGLAKPTVETDGEVIQLPPTARLRLHPPSAIAA